MLVDTDNPLSAELREFLNDSHKEDIGARIIIHNEKSKQFLSLLTL